MNPIPVPVTAADARRVAAHIETVQRVVLERVKAMATCAPGTCGNCDALRLVGEDVKRITPEHINTIRGLADKLDWLEAGYDS